MSGCYWRLERTGICSPLDCVRSVRWSSGCLHAPAEGCVYEFSQHPMETVNVKRKASGTQVPTGPIMPSLRHTEVFSSVCIRRSSQ